MVATLLNDFGRDREVNRVDGGNVDNILLSNFTVLLESEG